MRTSKMSEGIEMMRLKIRQKASPSGPFSLFKVIRLHQTPKYQFEYSSSCLSHGINYYDRVSKSWGIERSMVRPRNLHPTPVSHIKCKRCRVALTGITEPGASKSERNQQTSLLWRYLFVTKIDISRIRQVTQKSISV